MTTTNKTTKTTTKAKTKQKMLMMDIAYLNFSMESIGKEEEEKVWEGRRGYAPEGGWVR